MIRHLAIATFAAVALGGCVSDYAYRGGSGDYYYGSPSVEYYDYGYGAPYGSVYGYPGRWNGGLSIGYGYGGYGYGGGYGGYYGGYGSPYGYYGGYPYFPPYYWHRPRPPHHDHRPPPATNTGPVTGGRLPPNRVQTDPPRSPVYAVPRNGQRPLQPPRPGGVAWPGLERTDNTPPMSRPMPPAVRQPPAGRVPMVEQRPSAPPMSQPSRPTPAPALRSGERMREVER